MSSSVSDDDEKPLDPASARIVAKVRMLMLIGGGTMLIGIAAIFLVIGYRVFKSEGSTVPARVAEVSSLLPKGARVVSTAASGDRIVVTVEVGGKIEIRTYDLVSLRPTGRLTFSNEP